MATQQEVMNLIGYYSDLKNKQEDALTHGIRPSAKLLQDIAYVENAVQSQYSSQDLAWINTQVSGARASMREAQTARETTRVEAIKRHVTDKSFMELTQNMNGGRGMTAEGIASVSVDGTYRRHTGKETFDRETLETAMPHIINPDGKQFAKDFDDYSEKMDGLVQRYREDPVKGKKALDDVGMTEDDVTHWESQGLKYELFNRWAEEDKDMDEYEDVVATDSEQMRADLICAMGETEQVWEAPASGLYDMELQNEDSLHGDVARSMMAAEFNDNISEE